MKKMIVMLLAFVLLLGLCACGKEEAAPTEPAINVQPKVEATVAVEETAAPTEAPTEAATEAAPAADQKALAESCIEKDISELYALIGEPASSEYAPSCLVEGEDGALYYDGFVVYTTREGDVETVYYVE
jgi:hypothetical protein